MQVHIKCTIDGAPKTGRSTLIETIKEKQFVNKENSFRATFDLDISRKEYDVNMNVEEVYATNREYSYTYGDVLVVAVRPTMAESYSFAETSILPDIKQFAPKCPIVIVATAMDELTETEAIAAAREAAEKLKETIGAIAYFETSSKNYQGVEKLFESIANLVMDHLEGEMPKYQENMAEEELLAYTATCIKRADKYENKIKSLDKRSAAQAVEELVKRFPQSKLAHAIAFAVTNSPACLQTIIDLGGITEEDITAYKARAGQFDSRVTQVFLTKGFVYSILAFLQSQLNLIDDALTNFAKALELGVPEGRDFAFTSTFYYACMVRKGQYEEALQKLDELVKKLGAGGRAVDELKLFSYLKQENWEAISSSQLDVQRATAVTAYGLYKLGKVQEAREMLEGFTSDETISFTFNYPFLDEKWVVPVREILGLSEATATEETTIEVSL